MTDKCPHPARKGRHEEYARSDGSSFCRACGAEIMPRIERETCVRCGALDLPRFVKLGADVPKMGGRKIGYRADGTRFDAGYICGDCMGA